MNLIEAIKKRQEHSESRPFIVALEGIIGSGKSHWAEKLKDSFGEGAQILSTDLFIIVNRDEWQKRVAEGKIVLKEWYDLDKIKQALEKVKRREKFTISGLYDLSNGQFTKSIEFDARECSMVVLEGLFALDGKFGGFVDLKVFLDAPEKISVDRAEKRDTAVRNLTHEKWMLKKAIFHDYYLPYIEKQRRKANLIWKD